MVFRGEGGELLARLQGRMERASLAERFEQAGEIKAQIALVRGGLLGSALHFSSRGAAAGRDWALDVDPSVRQGKGGGGGGGIKRDVVAVGRAGDLACFQLFQVRDGRLTGRLGFTYRVEEKEEEGLSRGDVLQACLERYWGDALESRSEVGAGLGGLCPPLSSAGKGRKEGVYVADVPDEIVTADALPDGGAELLSELLSVAREAAAADADADANADTSADARADANADAIASADAERGAAGQGGAVNGPTNEKSEGGGKAPERRTRGKLPSVAIVHGGGSAGGERHHLCVMVLKNAELEAKRLRKGGEDTVRGLSQLARMLGLASPPARIEGYDVSHTGGGQAVASAVSFVDGNARPDEHRRYRIQSTEVKKGHSDDYASLREVIARRFAPPSQSHLPGDGGAAAAAEGAAAVTVPRGPVPDLVLVDGGRGQLAAAMEGAADAADAWRSLWRDTEDVTTAGLLVGGITVAEAVAPAERNSEARPPSSPLSSSSSSFSSSTSSSSPSPSTSSSFSSSCSSTPSSFSTSIPSSSPSSATPSPSRMGRGVSDEDPDDILLLPALPSTDLARAATHAGVGTDMGASTSASASSNSNSATVDVGGGRRVAMVSLAKKEEEVYVPWAIEPLEVTGGGGGSSGAGDEDGPQSPGVMILRQVR